MCSKLKVITVCHRSGIFVADFDHNQHVNIVLLLLTLNKYLSAGCESHNVLKTQKAIYLFRTKSCKSSFIQ